MERVEKLIVAAARFTINLSDRLTFYCNQTLSSRLRDCRCNGESFLAVAFIVNAENNQRRLKENKKHIGALFFHSSQNKFSQQRRYRDEERVVSSARTTPLVHSAKQMFYSSSFAQK